mgnify:CR=1 FL=1
MDELSALDRGAMSNVKVVDFGTYLAEALVAHLEPIQTKYHALMEDQTVLKKTLLDGAEAADALASQTNLWAKKAMGFTTREDLA